MLWIFWLRIYFRNELSDEHRNWCMLPKLQNRRKKLITFLPLSCYNNDEWCTPLEMLLNHPVNCLLSSRSHPQICWPSVCSWQAQLSKSVFLAQILLFQNRNLFICKKRLPVIEPVYNLSVRSFSLCSCKQKNATQIHNDAFSEVTHYQCHKHISNLI